MFDHHANKRLISHVSWVQRLNQDWVNLGFNEDTNPVSFPQWWCMWEGFSWPAPGILAELKKRFKLGARISNGVSRPLYHYSFTSSYKDHCGPWELPNGQATGFGWSLPFVKIQKYNLKKHEGEKKLNSVMFSVCQCCPICDQSEHILTPCTKYS